MHFFWSSHADILFFLRPGNFVSLSTSHSEKDEAQVRKNRGRISRRREEIFSSSHKYCTRKDYVCIPQTHNDSLITQWTRSEKGESKKLHLFACMTAGIRGMVSGIASRYQMQSLTCAEQF